MIRKLMASSALIALMSAGTLGVAQAQSDPATPAIVQDNAAAVPDSNAAPATQVAESKQAITPDHPTLASTIIGKSVYSSTDPQSDNIGDVNDLIVAEDGSVTHAVIGVGGFLGIGEKNVAVPFDELKVVENNGDFRLVYSATKEQLEAAPAFDRTAYDPAVRGAPATTNTAATDSTGLTPVAPAPATTDTMAAAPAASDTTGTAPAAPAATDTMAAAPATNNDQVAASGSTSATSDQMAASDTTATTDQNANATAPAAQDFVQTAATANKFEIDSSKLALDHAQNEDVKNFAQRMIDDHTKAGDDLKAAVKDANAGIDVPDELDQAHKDQLDKLQAANTDFDRQYVDMQVKAHDDAVNLFQGYADSGDNDKIKQFAANTLPTLKDHQKMIRDISDKLGSSANTAMTTDTDQQANGQQMAANQKPANATADATASDNNVQPAGELAFVRPGADQVYANWLIGKGVYGPENQSIGEVHDLVLQKDTGVRVALIDVGGFLGIGEKTVAIPFTDLQYKKVDNSNEPQVTVAMSKDDLKNQPAYDTNQLDKAAAANAPATTDNTVANNGVTTDQTAPATTNQVATNNNSVEVTTGSVPPSQDMAATSLIGTTVYGSDDSNIGEVGDIVFDKKGDINAIIVDVGGFLGIGEKPVALSFDQLNVRSDQSGNLTLVANATKDQLNNAPTFEPTARQ